MSDPPGTVRLSVRRELDAQLVENAFAPQLQYAGKDMKEAVEGHRDAEHPGCTVVARTYYVTYEEVVRP